MKQDLTKHEIRHIIASCKLAKEYLLHEPCSLQDKDSAITLTYIILKLEPEVS